MTTETSPSARLHVIFLAGLDYATSGHETAAIRGIRSIWEFFGQEHSFGDARRLVDEFQENPTEKRAIYVTDDEVGAQEAIEAAMEHHQGAALFELDPDDLTLPHPASDAESEDGEEAFSVHAYMTAMALLAMEDGNPTHAYFRANQLARTTGDSALYEEVQQAILSVFPPTPQGPGLHIFGMGED